MKRATLFAVVASALSLPIAAYAQDVNQPGSAAKGGPSSSSQGDAASRIPAAKGASGDTSSTSAESQLGSQPCASMTGADRERCLDQQSAASGGSASSPDDSSRIPAAKGAAEDTPAPR